MSERLQTNDGLTVPSFATIRYLRTRIRNALLVAVGLIAGVVHLLLLSLPILTKPVLAATLESISKSQVVVSVQQDNSVSDPVFSEILVRLLIDELGKHPSIDVRRASKAEREKLTTVPRGAVEDVDKLSPDALGSLDFSSVDYVLFGHLASVQDSLILTVTFVFRQDDDSRPVVKQSREPIKANAIALIEYAKPVADAFLEFFQSMRTPSFTPTPLALAVSCSSASMPVDAAAAGGAELRSALLELERAAEDVVVGHPWTRFASPLDTGTVGDYSACEKWDRSGANLGATLKAIDADGLLQLSLASAEQDPDQMTLSVSMQFVDNHRVELPALTGSTSDLGTLNASLRRALSRLFDAAASTEKHVIEAQPHPEREGEVDRQRMLAEMSVAPDYVDFASIDDWRIAIPLRGIAVSALRDLPLVLWDLEKFSALRPDIAVARVLAARLLAVGDKVAALDELELALQIEPDNYAAHALRGWLLRSLGEFADALEALERARALPENHRQPNDIPNVWDVPNKTWLNNEIASLHLDLGNFAAARATFEWVLNRPPPGNDVERKILDRAYAHTGFLMDSSGESKEAIELLREGRTKLEIDSPDSLLIKVLAGLLYEYAKTRHLEGDTALAVGLMNEAAALRVNPFASYSSGLLLMMQADACVASMTWETFDEHLSKAENSFSDAFTIATSGDHVDRLLVQEILASKMEVTIARKGYASAMGEYDEFVAKFGEGRPEEPYRYILRYLDAVALTLSADKSPGMADTVAKAQNEFLFLIREVKERKTLRMGNFSWSFVLLRQSVAKYHDLNGEDLKSFDRLTNEAQSVLAVGENESTQADRKCDV